MALTALEIKNTKKPGYLNDGKGLYLKVAASGARSWIYRFKLAGRSRDMGLGAYPAVSLAEARERATEARGRKEQGIDPIETRKTAVAAVGEAEGGRHITFEKAAERYIADHEAAWKNPKTAQRWRARLRDYAFPCIGRKDVDGITTDDVLRCLKPIWYTKAETATKTRGYIEMVLSWAAVKGYRDRNQINPAAWKGNLQHLLKARKASDVEHHPAMPYADLPAFMLELRNQDALSARALEFIILTACRSGDVRLAPWSEIDLGKALWTIPKARQLKGERIHRVPLSTQAVAILESLPRIGGYVFPGAGGGKPFSDMAFNMLMRRMAVADYHTHGFRSSFKDWAVECTSYPHAISEMALAHEIGSDTEKAYRRSDFFDKRRKLMESWAAFCSAQA